MVVANIARLRKKIVGRQCKLITLIRWVAMHSTTYAYPVGAVTTTSIKQYLQLIQSRARVIASKKDREDNGGQKVGPNVRDRNHEFERVLSGLAGHTSAGTV